MTIIKSWQVKSENDIDNIESIASEYSDKSEKDDELSISDKDDDISV